MPIGRYIRGLNSYDLLGNLIPGIVALVVTFGTFTTPPVPGGVAEYALFAVVSYLVGGLIQSIASTAVGSRKHFDRTMSGAEKRTKSELAETGTGSDSEDSEEDDNKWTVGNGDGPLWKFSHPFIWPLAFWLRPDRGEELDDAILVNRIWEYLIDTHEIPFRTTSYSVLYHVMSSRVDNIQSPSRATRMQALRNLNRGMWITSWFASILLISVLIIDFIFSVGDLIPIIDHVYEQPLFFQYWMPAWMLALVSVICVLFFWLEAESSEEDYIEYLFADYVVAVASEAEDVSFDQDSPLEFTGELSMSSTELEQLLENEGGYGEEDVEPSKNDDKSGDELDAEEDTNDDRS